MNCIAPWQEEAVWLFLAVPLRVKGRVRLHFFEVRQLERSLAILHVLVLTTRVALRSLRAELRQGESGPRRGSLSWVLGQPKLTASPHSESIDISIDIAEHETKVSNSKITHDERYVRFWDCRYSLRSDKFKTIAD